MKTYDNDTEIASRIRDLISELRYRSVLAFSNDVGIDCSNLSKKLKGLSSFTERDIIAISYALGVSKTWLACGTGDKYLSTGASEDGENLDCYTKLRIDKARLEERVKCLEHEKVFLQRMLDKSSK